ncbi:hypothetical protein HF086_016409 [Spodoptera exigua]|uniref:Uncharacterized protein n=1 Tax=Spodoptera exigua TaxID=7107 RepID=A0A922MZ69_SPOEX|nr:hypothetical protein HF086_016409 [Spodoptera exigua]
MLVQLCWLVVTVILFTQYETICGDNNIMPNYVKKALKEKTAPQAFMRREKTKTIHNLEMKDLFNKVKEITRTLNLNALRNGYKVDYKFRILG